MKMYLTKQWRNFLSNSITEVCVFVPLSINILIPFETSVSHSTLREDLSSLRCYVMSIGK
jgi:hypothetical protein